jgi:signal transduction histidine kinase
MSSPSIGEGGGYQRVLLDLAALDKSDYEDVLRRILRLEAETLGIERVNYWRLESEPLAIHCEEAFERQTATYRSGQVLRGVDFPEYFEALGKEEVIAADDALNDPRTAEFAESYLVAHGIGAMMDVPVWFKGRLAGVLCHEHVGGPRAWTDKEKEFAVAMAQAISTSIEVRERRRAEEALWEAEREKLRLGALEQAARAQVAARDEFLSVASHELYTPLTSLQLAAQSLKKLEVRGPASERALVLVERQVRRLTELVSSLLDVSRIQSGRLSLSLASCDLAELARGVCERFADEAVRAGSELTLEAPSPVVGRYWDRSHLDQVLTNLLSNALKFGAGEPIGVRVALDGPGRAKLTVRDCGIGIPAEKLPRIFQRFERAAPARSYGGLGLGLYIVHAIVEAHGGTVEVTSELGEGTTLTVTLPLDGPTV